MDATNSTSDVPTRSAAGRWILMAVAAAALAVYLVVIRTQRPNDVGTTGPAIGRSLAYLALEPLTGDAPRVSVEDLAGHVTLLNFWGTWCPPCIREFPHLIELAEHFGPRDEFRFYPVSCGGAGDDAQLDLLREDTAAFLRRGTLNDLPTPIRMPPVAGRWSPCWGSRDSLIRRRWCSTGTAGFAASGWATIRAMSLK